jgi:hypothetical protein
MMINLFVWFSLTGAIRGLNASHKQRSKLDAFLRRIFLQKIGLLAESDLMRLLG